MLLGLALLFVGAVLFVNGIWLHGKIDDREIVLINVVAALVTLAVAVSSAFGHGANVASVKTGALTLLFTTTYLWVAYNRLVTVDGRGPGWFSLFVAVTVVLVFVQSVLEADGPLSLWLALNWGVWAVLWLMYFVLLALQRPIGRATATATILSGIFTGWLPGMLLLNGM